MNNRLFESMGIGNWDIGIILLVLVVLVLALVIVVIFQSYQLNVWKKKYNNFMIGRKGSSLEKELLELCEDTKELRHLSEDNSRRIKELFHKHKTTYQKLGIVKYDAFKQMGGNMSFCVVLLDELNNGFILNSVHSTEGCYFYTKEVVKGECDIVLGTEEQMALDKAVGK